LSTEQIEIIRLRIQAGGPGTGTIGNLNPPESISILINKVLGFRL
jgi:hypothetical protein